jgi:hypothetical protein
MPFLDTMIKRETRIVHFTGGSRFHSIKANYIVKKGYLTDSYLLRPNTSFSRPSSRGLNTSLGSRSIWSSRVSTKAQQPDSEYSAEKDGNARKVRHRDMRSVSGNGRSCSISQEDKLSDSTIKQNIS